jgi:hypothetical protein
VNKVVRNEERKLTATYFNGIAIAVMAAGTFAPVVAIMQSGDIDGTSGPFVIGCILVSVALHSFARLFLRGMEE